MTFTKRCQALEAKIMDSYTQGITIDDAEKLAGEFLHAMMQVSDEIKTNDLDARMRKSGVKAVRAAVYTSLATGVDKKPTEGSLEHSINLNELVQGEQKALDEAEAERDNLERYYNIFMNAHLHFRSIAKGKMG